MSEKWSGGSNPRAPAMPNGGERVTVAARHGDVPSGGCLLLFGERGYGGEEEEGSQELGAKLASSGQ